MVFLLRGGNFHSKPQRPFHQGLSLPPIQLLSVNQVANVNPIIPLRHSKLLLLPG